MPTNICIFEDEHFNRLHPLTLTRPVFELRCGISLLREKIQEKIAKTFPDHRLYLFCREYLVETMRELLKDVSINKRTGEYCLLLNGRFIFGENLSEFTSNNQEEIRWMKDGEVIAAWIKGTRLESILENSNGILPTPWFKDIPIKEQIVKGDFIRYPWDLVEQNPKQIETDFNSFNHGGRILGKIYPNVTLLGEKNIYIGPDTEIKPGVVIDAEKGSIFINDKVTIMPNASLEGPIFVGSNSTIKMGAKIYSGTSIGEVCKVGGEIEETIIHSYSNKQHEGFLGHAYIGQWVNIGADSNNSDLKNNYSTVKVYIAGELVDSNSTFVGLFMGDHSKCGINTMFNTGTVVGVMCNLYGAGYLYKFIPSFSWGGAEKIETYNLDKALQVAQTVMARRKKTLSVAQEKLLRYIFEMTASERE